MKVFLHSSVKDILNFAAAAAFFLAACTRPSPPPPQGEMKIEPPPQPQSGQPGYKGKATFYGEGDGFAGKKTASGERFNPRELTAAHRSYPIGTRLRVTNLKNNKSVIVRVNDRGPFRKGKEIDLSARAAEEIDLKESGSADVRIEKVDELATP